MHIKIKLGIEGYGKKSRAPECSAESGGAHFKIGIMIFKPLSISTIRDINLNKNVSLG